MVVDIVIQTEINRKENKLYPVRERPYHPNFSVPGLTGKFYARHDFPDPSLLDEALENAIMRYHLAVPKNKYNEPLTSNMEYGWYLPAEVVGDPAKFFYPKHGCWITEIGSVIAKEDMKNPKKPFTGVPFKL